MRERPIGVCIYGHALSCGWAQVLLRAYLIWAQKWICLFCVHIRLRVESVTDVPVGAELANVGQTERLMHNLRAARPDANFLSRYDSQRRAHLAVSNGSIHFLDFSLVFVECSHITNVHTNHEKSVTKNVT